MSFQPVLPSAVLIGLGVLLILIRMAALYRLLAGTGSGRYRRVVARWCGLTLAVLLLVVAAFRPGIEAAAAESSERTAVTSSNLNVFFVVDRSVDVRVQDYGDNTSRMSGIRNDIDSLISQYPRARFAVISFASKAGVDWPLSEDVWSLKPMIAGLSPYTMAAPDALYTVDATAARDVLRDKLKAALAHHRNTANVVFYLGAGAGGSRVAAGGFELGSDGEQAMIAGGAVLGYGTEAGGPIPQGWVNENLTYLSDPSTGAELSSALDETRLRTIAGQLGVPYFHRESGQTIAAVVPALKGSSAPPDDTLLVASRLVERTELYWVFTLVAAALVLTEIYVAIREFRRNRMVRQRVTS